MDSERRQLELGLEVSLKFAFEKWCELLKKDIDKQIKEGGDCKIENADKLRDNFEEWITTVVDDFIWEMEWEELEEELKKLAKP